MRKVHVVSTAIAVVQSSLLFAPEPWHSLAFYAIAIFAGLAFVGLLAGSVSGDTAQQIRDGVLISSASSAYQIIALALTGHPILAAISLVLNVLLVAAAFRSEVAHG
ncbi:hypothetical protein [Pseudomonas kuykendallii]|uniref:hypothetical protein n=1 Tax=Pseudomonas kuykendallii TaxID=1007099 RepID=UPI0028D6AB9B|nr:hypothetical protein [Pseudomonas kuykendallii]